MKGVEGGVDDGRTSGRCRTNTEHGVSGSARRAQRQSLSRSPGRPPRPLRAALHGLQVHRGGHASGRRPRGPRAARLTARVERRLPASQPCRPDPAMEYPVELTHACSWEPVNGGERRQEGRGCSGAPVLTRLPLLPLGRLRRRSRHKAVAPLLQAGRRRRLQARRAGCRSFRGRRGGAPRGGGGRRGRGRGGPAGAAAGQARTADRHGERRGEGERGQGQGQPFFRPRTTTSHQHQWTLRVLDNEVMGGWQDR